MTKTITWNSVASTTIPELVVGPVTRELVGAMRGNFVAVPGLEGDWFFSERRGRRRITAECFIEATIPTRRDTMLAVANWLDVEEEAQLIISDEPDVYYLGVLAEPPEPEEWREFGIFDLVWMVQPYSFATSLTVESFTSDTNDIHTWAAGLDVFVYPVVEITPTNGTMTGFTIITNADESLTWAGTCASGDTITVNAIAAVVLAGVNTDLELTGAYDYADLSMQGVVGDYPRLIEGAGNNSLQFILDSGTATAIDVDITYRKRYRR